MAVQGRGVKIRIFAVLVLYRKVLEDSVSYRSLLRSAEAANAPEVDLRILVYDNTPGSTDISATGPGDLPRNVLFVSDTGNSGLARAYNQALVLALHNGYEWLLTLDQDTALPVDFLSELAGIVESLDERPDVAAVVPLIRAEDRVVSPFYFAAGAWARFFAPGYRGVPREAVSAFNSGSLIRTAALRQIGGYDRRFWLDHSDSLLFRRLKHFGKRVFVAGTIELNHEFSLLQMNERVSPERYRAMLLAEAAFWDMEMSALGRLERTMRLIARLGKHVRRKDSSALIRLTMQALWERNFRSRRYRMALWRKATEERPGASLAQGCQGTRPVVSVCMASYNGERYVEAQLRSVIPQLGDDDEIIVIDDASSDSTPQRLRNIRSELELQISAPRMTLVEHEVNRGVVRSFEEALRGATGDVLFLCDNDDLWAADKVSRVLAAFDAQPATQLVCHGLLLIDENDQLLSDTSFLRHRRFSSRLGANLLHNQYQGSAMAFRSSLLRHILPLPVDRLFLHDAWIGMRNTLAGGETAYVDEPLLLYRRHASNFSQRLSRWKQFVLRLQIVAAHLRRFMQQT